MTDKTHFRKAFHSPYLGAVDITEPVIVTVDRVALEPDRTKQSKEHFNTAHWVEKTIRPGELMKPMILNATNSKFMAYLTGSKFIEDWAGARVEIWVDPDVRFGRDTVEGLRLRAAPAVIECPPELIAAAEEKAALGTKVFAQWFNDLGKSDRQLLGRKRRDTYLETAKVADGAPAGAEQ